MTRRTWGFILAALLIHGIFFGIFRSPGKNRLRVSIKADQLSTLLRIPAKTSGKKSGPARQGEPASKEPRPRPAQVFVTEGQNKEIQEARLPQPQSTAPAPSSQVDEIQRYIQEVIRILDSQKWYPRLSRENGEEGKVVVELIIDRSGDLLDVRLIQPSNYPRLNGATLRTVKTAAFPPLPAVFPKAKLVIQIPLQYMLRSHRG